MCAAGSPHDGSPDRAGTIAQLGGSLVFTISVGVHGPGMAVFQLTEKNIDMQPRKCQTSCRIEAHWSVALAFLPAFVTRAPPTICHMEIAARNWRNRGDLDIRFVVVGRKRFRDYGYFLIWIWIWSALLLLPDQPLRKSVHKSSNDKNPYSLKDSRACFVPFLCILANNHFQLHFGPNHSENSLWLHGPVLVWCWLCCSASLSRRDIHIYVTLRQIQVTFDHLHARKGHHYYFVRIYSCASIIHLAYNIRPARK